MRSVLSYSKPEVTMQIGKSFQFPPRVLYENIYCYQDDFSILVCGGRDRSYKSVKSVYKLHGRELKCEKFTSMPNKLRDCKSAVVNSDLFILGGYSKFGVRGFNKSILKFCNKTKTWSSKAQLPLDDDLFCVCSFKENLYVIYKTGQCFVYSLKSDKWFQLANKK